MNVLLPWVAQLLHLAMMIVAAPLAAGSADWLQARLAGRAGAPLTQPWRDLLALLRKQRTAVESVSVVSRAAPVAGLAATMLAAALVPSFALGMASAPLADVFVIVSLLITQRVALALAALDAGSARPGFAAAQGSAMAVLAESAIMLVVFALAVTGGSANLDVMMTQQRDGLLLPSIASALALGAVLVLLFVEAQRTGIEQVLSGPDLAVARFGAWLRRIVWIDLACGLFAPIGVAAGFAEWPIGLAGWAARLGACVAGVAATQALLGQASRRSAPGLLGAAIILSLLAVVMVLANAGPV